MSIVDSCIRLLAALKVNTEGSVTVTAPNQVNLAAPDNAHQLKGNFIEIALEWAKVSGASEYLTAIRKEGSNDLIKLLHTTSNKLIVNGLEPGAIYEADIFSVRQHNNSNTYLISPNPLTITLKTDFIVHEDFPPVLLGEPCAFGDCSTMVSVVDNYFDWAPETAHYCIEILRNTTAEVVARNYLRKSVNGNGNHHVQYCTQNSPCSDTALAPVLNGATPGACGEAAADRICGSFAHSETRNLAYALIFRPEGCRVCVLSELCDQDYFVRVRLCQAGSGEVR